MQNLSKLLFPLTLFFIYTSCSKDDVVASDTSSSTTSGTIDSTYTTGTAEGSTETAVNADDSLENSTFSNTVTITFGSTVTITNPLASSGVTITTSGSDVTITSTVSGVAYVVSGTTSDGSVKLYSDNKYELTLSGASITNSDGPALNIQSKKRGFIVLASGTTNTLTDGSTYATATNDEDQKGTIFSEGQLIFSGSGSLTVKGNYKHAICSDDYIRVRAGSITVSSATKDAIHTNDAFIMDNGTLNLTASDDGIQVDEGYVVINDGTINISSVGKGITASYTDSDNTITPYVTINGGSLYVKSSANEGIESKSILTINDGYIVTNTSDDGINAETAIYINGGYIYSYSTDNDAMDSNGTFTITGGKVVAVGSKAPEASFDCDARTFKLTGGMIVGIGGATSGPSTSVSTINSVVMGSGSASTIVHIEAADGTEAMTFLAPISYSTLIYASSKLKSSTSYTVYTGGSVSDGTNFNGLYTSGTYSKGTSGTTFTTSSVLTQIGGSISKN
ncbi:carbohydrate-binding domain-containing protein [Rhizosphaericola mali]|uniref:Carbohydrate-binding domain-containing protein n=1 Tax=Rhizosphaericola mali TaxID=2545455 RepID=A0A5P2G6W5_9BACT|nr:carbohydrate-binding domain-containing protein [Rhizosphaericola mali]QES90448.1 carbohydrate-binding domain-containing protein [Rhizosphaericola mali]